MTNINYNINNSIGRLIFNFVIRNSFRYDRYNLIIVKLRNYYFIVVIF